MEKTRREVARYQREGEKIHSRRLPRWTSTPLSTQENPLEIFPMCACNYCMYRICIHGSCRLT